jgi:hypothetical protein
MKRPKQLPAVDRNSMKCAAVPAGAMTGPSGFWDVVGGIAKVAAPIALGVL